MYHCHINIYLTGGSCRTFELIREMTPLEHFTHEFFESKKPEGTEAARADVILANMEGMDKDGLQILIQNKNNNAEVILLADREQILQATAFLPEIKDIWTQPMGDAEIRFRLSGWQRGYKLNKDYWETSQYLEETINHIPSLIWYKNKDGIHEKVNDSFCKTVNKSKKQVEGRGHAYIWDVEQDDPACIESEREVMGRRRTCVSEEIIKTGEGMKILTTYKSPLYDLDGSVMGTVGVAIDVTQERAYEQEIIKKNSTLEAVFTTMDCGVMCHTVDGRQILSINRAALEILGYDSQEEMMEAGFDMVAASVVDEDKIKLRQCIRELKKEGDTVSIEYRVCHESGEIRHVMGNIKLMRENGELVYQRFLLDCTDRKLQEKENERRQGELIHALSMDYSLVCYFDLVTGAGVRLRVDDEDKSLFGDIFDGELLLENCMEDYIRQYVCEEDQEVMRRTVCQGGLKEEMFGKKQYHEYYRVEAGGGRKYFQMKAVRTGAWSDKSQGIVLGLRSADEEIRSEVEQKNLLKDALLQANKASRAKSVFLSNMSHDIRTPMNAIVGFTTLALSHIEQKDKVEEYLGKIKTSGDHLLNLINDVLDVSHIESGKMHIEEEPCNLPDILHGLRNIVQADIHAKHLKLFIHTEEIRNEDIYCDKLRLNQVLLNILSNAVKYTEAGGMIHISVIEKDGAPKGHAKYEFHVRDTGIGMSREFAKHIFEPFERENNTTISGIQGTGLGMTITKNIVDMMNGSLEVESEQGVGTEFTVTLIFRLSTGIKEQKAEEETGCAEIGTGRILLAEDNELNQEIAVEILSDAGFDIEVAGNGQIALEMLEQSQPGYYQVVLMDIQMPVMNGYEAARKIRRIKDQALSQIPILAMTANAFEEDKKEALKCGMNGHITKPIDVDNLLDMLGELLNHSYSNG